MKPLRMFKAILILLSLLSVASAQLDFLALNVDYATFSGKYDKTYTEVYVSFFQSDLTYNIEDTLNVAHFSHLVKIMQNDSIIHEFSRNYQNDIPLDTEPGLGSQFMDVFAFELEPGDYTIVTYITDNISKRQGEYKLEADIPLYKSGLSLSDIQIATKISKTDKKSNFSAKNNLEILPNPSRTYGIAQPILYFYFEVYDLKLNTNKQNRYNYHYYISDVDGRRVRDFAEKVKSSGSKVIAEAGGTNIITLASNSYFLNIEIEDLQSRKKALARKKFRVYKPSRQSSEEQIQARMEGYEEYMGYSKEQLETEFKQVTYIASKQEVNIFEELDTAGKRRFLAEFWKRRDPDQTTEVNEYKGEYFESLQYANATFSSAFKEGWRTDQGRVILVYGKPDEIERNPSSLNTSPYEIWYYYALEGGAEFVFGDLTGHGDFELLHSNYRNEIKDPTWRERIGAVRRDFGGDTGIDNY